MNTAKALPHLRTGDTVKVLSGTDRGKTGKISQVFPLEGRVVVDGVNARKKNIRASRTRSQRGKQQGEIITYNAPIAASNVMLLCPHCHKPTRIGHARIAGERKKRVCKACKQMIDA